MPLEEARLSSFLAADRENSADDVLEAFLSGEVIDMQSRLNFMNLVKLSGTGSTAKAEISETDMAAFTRLYEQLDLPLAELNAAVNELRSTTELAANDPMPSRTALKPRKLAHLGWLGIGPGSLAALEPHVAVLPERTTLNINTASPQAIVASTPRLDLAQAQRLVAERERNPFKTLADASRLLPALEGQLTETQHGTRSRYFEVRGRLRLDDAVVEERSLVVRNNLDVRVSWRERIAGR
jgi:general secretion pathway protein K